MSVGMLEKKLKESAGTVLGKEFIKKMIDGVGI